ncbi:MAG TPA: hypothetical protein PLD54_00645 [Candidatus Levybacteria bacterium]|nr:hypothetical protein [Candidatus Levybacteria bacterium]
MRSSKLNTPATKDDLLSFEFRTDLKLDTLERKIEDKAIKHRDKVLTAIDSVMKQLEIIRQENIVGFHRFDEHLDDNEKRISKLEKSISSS